MSKRILQNGEKFPHLLDHIEQADKDHARLSVLGCEVGEVILHQRIGTTLDLVATLKFQSGLAVTERPIAGCSNDGTTVGKDDVQRSSH